MGHLTGAAAPYDSMHPLVGRDRERRRLREALTAALDGRGGLVLIAGEAGAGKSALVRALGTDAAAAALVLVGRAYDLGAPPPYGVWLDLLGIDALARHPDPLDEIRAALQPAAGERGSQATIFTRLFAGFARLVEHRPLVCILDDLHWADLASLDLLRFVSRQLAGLPLLLVGTYRADELIETHPLAKLLPALVREAAPLRLALTPLEVDATRELVRANYSLTPGEESRLLDYLQERAAGNPLYLGELLRTLEEEGVLRQDAGGGWSLADLAGVQVPPLLRQVIAERLARLGLAANRWLAVAAVIGQEVPLTLWATVAEAPEEDLLALVERAMAARVLDATTDGMRVQFHHPLIRQALYDSLPPPRRRAIHQRIADHLLAMRHPDPDAVADHLQRAGDARAAEWLVKAGERAWRGYAWLTAAARYEAALAIAEQSGMAPRERVALLLTLGQLWRYEDRHRGRRFVLEAERLALALNDATLVAAARFDGGHLRVLSSDARAVAERSVGLAEMAAALPALEALTPGERARLPALILQRASGEELYHRGALVYWLAWVGRLAEALALAAPLIARGPGTTARGLAALGMVYRCLGQPEEAERALADSQAISHAAGQAIEVQYRLGDRLGNAWSYFVDQPHRWQPLIDVMAEATRNTAGARHLESNPNVLPFLMLRGNWDEARRQTAEMPGDDLAFVITQRHLGDTSALWAAIGRSLPHGPATEPGGHALTLALEVQQLAIALAIDGEDLPLAQAWLAAHDRWLAWSGSILGLAEGQLGWAAYHRAAGARDRARQHAEAALAHATDPRQPLALLSARRLLGQLATDAGQRDDAQAHLAEALALTEACAAPYERALTLLAQAEMYQAGERWEAAEVALVEARATCVQLQARPAMARCATLAARLQRDATASTAAARIVPTPRYPAHLTVREVEVLRLIAAGHSNRQIASILSRSERTIERHIENIYRKIDAHSKADATAFAFRHDLV